jgi:hypothetical protein
MGMSESRAQNPSRTTRRVTITVIRVPAPTPYCGRYRQSPINNAVGHATRASLNAICNGCINRIARDWADAPIGELRLLRCRNTDIDQRPERGCAKHIGLMLIDLAFDPGCA